MIKKTTVVCSFLLLMLLLVLTSCGSDMEGLTGIQGRYDACWSGNTYFYIGTSAVGSDKIRFQRIDNIQETGLPVYSNLLSEGEDPFADVATFSYIMEDPWATERNDGLPVLILIASYWQTATEPARQAILSYNTATNKVTTIVENYNPMGSKGFFLYGDILYYTTDDGDQGVNVNRINVDGSNHSRMENPNGDSYTLLSVSDGTLYYANDNERVVYASALDFSNEIKVAENVHPWYMATVCGEYFYYPTQEVNEATSYLSLYRVRTDGTGEPELVLTEVAVGAPMNGVYYYYPLDNMVTITHRGHEMKHIQTKLYAYDLKTGETRLIYDIDND